MWQSSSIVSYAGCSLGLLRTAYHSLPLGVILMAACRVLARGLLRHKLTVRFPTRPRQTHSHTLGEISGLEASSTRESAVAAMSANMMPLSKLPAGDPAYSSPQIIEDRYIDDQKLLAVCKEKFGSNYKLKV